MEMCDLLMSYDYDHGHELEALVVKVMESKRCKHDRIAVLTDNASAAKRRADKAEEYNSELKVVYERRIEELQAELQVYQLLENAVHNIATRQLQQQPDPVGKPISSTPVAEQEPEDEDRRHTLETLARIGVKPYTGQSQNEDDTEGYEGDEEDDPEERLGVGCHIPHLAAQM